jgi:Tol biopolymer transport system component
MVRGWLAALLLAGCYSPTAGVGVPCSFQGNCPGDQVCIANTCEPPGGGQDAPLEVGDPDVIPDGTTNATWSTPTKVPGVNTASDEDDPSVTADRLTIVFGSNRNGNEDLFIGTRTTTASAFTVTSFDPLNSTSIESSPEISADGMTIYFTSNRNGANDIYFSFRIGPSWSPPSPVVQLSSQGDDSNLGVSPDGLTTIISRGNHMFIATRSSTFDIFTMPVAVPTLDITANVSAPSLTNGANAVYFHANNPRDLYVAHKQGPTNSPDFTPPVLIPELDTVTRDSSPFISADERYIVFGHDGDLFESTR